MPEHSTGRTLRLTLELSPELFEAIAPRAPEINREHPEQAEDGWLRGADAIADYIGAKTSRVYGLSSCRPPRIPVEKDVRSLIARRSELDAWLRDGGGKRP